MIIHSHVITFNEEQRLPWYLDHYGAIVDKIFVWDNHSTDRTLDIARAHPKVTVIPFGEPGVLSNLSFLDVKNNCWKQRGGDADRADWCIVGDVDELLWHEDLRKLLETTAATLITPAQAFTMICKDAPADYRDIQTGVRDDDYLKPCVINPKWIIEMRYNPGAHVAYPMGKVKLDRPAGLIMYHYKYTGFAETLVRYQERRARRSEQDKLMGWGTHYELTPEELHKKFEVPTHIVRQKHAASITKVDWVSGERLGSFFKEGDVVWVARPNKPVEKHTIINGREDKSTGIHLDTGYQFLAHVISNELPPDSPWTPELIEAAKLLGVIWDDS